MLLLYVVHCTIWYHSYNLKNVKNTHGGVLLLVTLLHGCFSRFLNCTHGIKSRNAPRILFFCERSLGFHLVSYWFSINFLFQNPKIEAKEAYLKYKKDQGQT